MNSSMINFLLIAGTSFCISLAPVTTKLLYHFFEPIPLVFLRFLLATILILPAFFLQKKSLFKAIKAIWPYVIFQSLNMLFYSVGIARTSADSASVLYCDVPLITAIISYFLIKERLGKMKLSGILIGFLGIILIVVLPLFQKGIKTGDLTGNMLILIATFMWALYVIFSKKIIEKGYSPISVTTVSFIVATILSLLLSPFVAKSNFILPIFNLKNLFLLLILGGVATVAGQFLMQTAIKRTSATIASLNQYIQPIFVVILAGITLGEKITIEFTVGVILVFAGVFIATYSRK